jgi:steroid 5-alpha reductase family enzyme
MMIPDFYLYNLLAVVSVMVTGWLISLRTDNVTVVDSLWGMGFVLVAWLTLFQVDGVKERQWLLTGLTTLWGVRLTLYLTWRNHGKGEDPRYAAWREATGRRFRLTSLFKVFLLQALFLWVIALTVQAGQTGGQRVSLGVTDGIGAMIWLVGFVFESVGDWQMAKFKADPSNRGKVMRSGLWRYTRHPNYFGESLIWWGLFIIAISDPSNWWTVISPLVITIVLLKMTGIPLTEKLSAKKRPGYGDYIATTSAFFPWPPKRRMQPLEKYYE